MFEMHLHDSLLKWLKLNSALEEDVKYDSLLAKVSAVKTREEVCSPTLLLSEDVVALDYEGVLRDCMKRWNAYGEGQLILSEDALISLHCAVMLLKGTIYSENINFWLQVCKTIGLRVRLERMSDHLSSRKVYTENREAQFVRNDE